MPSQFPSQFQRLTSQLSANAAANGGDVSSVKALLQRLSYYAAPDWGTTPYPDRALFDAIRAFQSAQGLKPDGVMKPDGESEAALKTAAKRLQSLGRNGDTVLAHINPQEAALLKAHGGSGTINPRTGLLEFFRDYSKADYAKAKTAANRDRVSSALGAARDRGQSLKSFARDQKAERDSAKQTVRDNANLLAHMAEDLNNIFNGTADPRGSAYDLRNAKAMATLHGGRVKDYLRGGEFGPGGSSYRPREVSTAPTRLAERNAQARARVADFVANRDAVRAAATTANAERTPPSRFLDAPQAAMVPGSVNSATTSAMTAPATTNTPGYQVNKAAFATPSVDPAIDRMAGPVARAEAKLKVAELNAMAPAATPAQQARNVKALTHARAALNKAQAKVQAKVQPMVTLSQAEINAMNAGFKHQSVVNAEGVQLAGGGKYGLYSDPNDPGLIYQSLDKSSEFISDIYDRLTNPDRNQGLNADQTTMTPSQAAHAFRDALIIEGVGEFGQMLQHIPGRNISRNIEELIIDQIDPTKETVGKILENATGKMKLDYLYRKSYSDKDPRKK